MPPGRVVESAPARLPLARQVGRSDPRTYSCRKPASKLSPAPTVSTGTTSCEALVKRSVPRWARRSFGAKLHHDQRHQLGQLVDRGFQVLRARCLAGFAFVRQEDIDVAQDFVQAAFPAIVGIVVGVERNREPLRFQQLK